MQNEKVYFQSFVGEKSRTLIIDADKIILHRGAAINEKTFQKTIIKMCEIKSVKSSLYMGNRLISKDAYFYTLNLKDSRKVTVTLYDYGKDAENEFLETISKNIV